MSTQISHLYDTFDQAERAVGELQAAGLDASDISIVANNADDRYKKDSDVKVVEAKHDKDRDGVDDRKEGALTGAGVGGVAVGAAGLLAGLGFLAIPGIGPVVAAGWLASTIAGVVTGGVAGGIVGALVESGVSKDDADMYAEAIRRGGALVVAKVPDAEQARYHRVLMEPGIDIMKRRAAYSQAGWTRFDDKEPIYTAEQVRKERDLYR